MNVDSADDCEHPLDGIRVIRIADSQNLATEAVTRLLAELGASVELKSLGASSATPQIGSDAMSLCARVDLIVVDAAGMRWLAGQGLSPSEIEASFPRVVLLSVTPFGMDSSWSDLPASELTLQALTSVLLSNGDVNDPPLPAGIPVASLAGALFGVIAALACLRETKASGKGQTVDQSLYDSVVMLLGTLLPIYFLTGEAPQRLGNRHAMAAPWNTYPTTDAWVSLCTMSQDQFAVLANTIGQPQLVGDERFLDPPLRVANVVELDALISVWTRRHSTEEAVRLLEDAGIVVSPIYPPALRGQDNQSLELLHLRQVGKKHPLGEGDHRSSGCLRLGQGPLAGLRVLEFAAHTAGPLAGRMLSLLGAEVVKVEPPSGDSARWVAHQLKGSSYLFHINNTNKRGITLDLMSPSGREAIVKLVKQADVFLTNLSRDTRVRLGLDEDRVAAINPSVVYTEVTGYRRDGSHDTKRAFDMSIQAVSGLMSLTGSPVNEPRKIAISIVDVFGALTATLGTVASLIHQDRTGRPLAVEAALMEVARWAIDISAGEVRAHGVSAPIDVVAAFPDHDVAVTATTEELRSLLADMGAPSAASVMKILLVLSEDESERAEIARLLAGISGTSLAREVVDRLTEHKIPAAILRDIREVAKAELTLERGLFTSVVYDEAELPVLNSPFKMSRSECRVNSAAPQLGEANPHINGIWSNTRRN